MRTNGTKQTAILAAALDYAKRGLPVFPCKETGLDAKKPYTAHGFKNATIDVTQIAEWWTTWPDAMIGLPTGAVSGFVVLDVDVNAAKEKDGEASLSALLQQNGQELPETCNARTPRGGRHIYFQHPGVKVPSRTDWLGDALDVRGDGGYVILPPSQSSNGAYTWMGEVSEAAPLSDWLCGLMVGSKTKKGPTAAVPAQVPHETERVRSALKSIPASDRTTWRDVGFALKTHFGGNGWQLFDEWSRTAPEHYDEQVNRAQWDTFKADGGITIASLFHLAKQHGWQAARTHCRSGSIAAEYLGGEVSVESAETDDKLFQRLANLAPIEYDRVRDAEAKRLNVRVATLDAEVIKRRPKTESETAVLQPWDSEVNVRELLDALAAEFEKFIILPLHAATILALWVLHTYLWQASEYSPILAITSPVKSCGKSRVLDLLEKLVCRPFRTGNLTEAVLFRVLDDREPTVLIDEYDTIPEDRRDALANILKHGFHRAGRVHRIEGDAEKKIVEFVVFGPKALACIKLSTLDAATVSRCINIRMQRKRSSQKVARLRRYDGTEWQRKFLRWATDNRDRIEAATAELPDALGDREQDIWGPLFVLANLARGEWPGLVNGAARALCEESGDAAQDTAVVLLRWIKTYFTDTGSDKVSSAKLVEWLNSLVDAPYASWGDGRGISQSDLRRHLAGFEIRPATIRLGAYTAKGYARDWFEDAFAAYLAETPDSAGNMVTTTANVDDSPVLPPVTNGECYQPQKCEKSNEDRHCYPVTAGSADSAPAEGLADQADLI